MDRGKRAINVTDITHLEDFSKAFTCLSEVTLSNSRKGLENVTFLISCTGDMWPQAPIPIVSFLPWTTNSYFEKGGCLACCIQS